MKSTIALLLTLWTTSSDLGTLNVANSANKNLKTSVLGQEMIKYHEGLRLQPYKDSGSQSTIGWGHLIRKDECYHEITVDQAQELFNEDLLRAENAVKAIVDVPLEQHQFDALVDFIFNLGPGKFVKSVTLARLNSGQYHAVAQRLPLYAKVITKMKDGTTIVKYPRGLKRRRLNEVNLWLGKITDKTQLV